MMQPPGRRHGRILGGSARSLIRQVGFRMLRGIYFEFPGSILREQRKVSAWRYTDGPGYQRLLAATRNPNTVIALPPPSQGQASSGSSDPGPWGAGRARRARA